jgi:hypothetical protein
VLKVLGVFLWAVVERLPECSFSFDESSNLCLVNRCKVAKPVQFVYRVDQGPSCGSFVEAVKESFGQIPNVHFCASYESAVNLGSNAHGSFGNFRV